MFSVSIRSSFIVIAAAVAGTFAWGRAVQAAPVAWGPAQNIVPADPLVSPDTDVSAAGTAVDAASFYTGSGPTTINSVTFNSLNDTHSTVTDPLYSNFTDEVYTTSAGNISVQVPNGNGGLTGNAPPAGLSTAFSNILGTVGFGFFLNGTVDLSGLTMGDAYQVQVFSAYADQAGSTKTTLTGTPSVTLDPSLAQFSTGTFVAGGPIQSFGFDFGNGGVYDLIDAVSLRDVTPATTGGGTSVPEPTSLGLIGVASVLALRRRRQA